MGKHRISLGRRGVAALAAAGAIVIGGTTVAMIGTGSAAEPLDILAVSSPTNTIVLPDLAPFKDNGTREGGKAEVSDEVGAPTGGGKAALRLSTPGANDKASYVAPVSAAATSLAAWIPTAAYSAYKLAGGDANQFPSLQLTVDPNGAAAGGFSTLTYEPIYNTATDSTTAGQWNRYAAGKGNWCSTRAIPGVIEESQRSCSNGGAKPLSDYVAAAPDLVVTGVVINQGSGNPGLESAVDLVTTPDTTYDFELTKPVVVVPPVDTTTTPPTTKPGNGNGGNNGGHPGNGNGGQNGNGNGNHPGNGNGGHPGNNNGNNGNWGGNGHCGC
ncbi:hypothetical protein [Actinomycetospora atypica]|uniref:Uncharacterized protein n=1 Tax=Actinomycetospora atypica TaxID=1290095 RepID=A0ABV9YPL4_9PSEU